MRTDNERQPMRFEDDLLPVLVEALNERRTEGLRPAHPTRVRGRRRALLAVGIAVVALALVVPIAFPRGPVGAEPAAAAMLRQLARRALAEPAQPAPAPGQYLYTKSESTQIYGYVSGHSLPNFMFSQQLTNETWYGADGSGRSAQTGGAISFPSAADHAAWVGAGSPSLDVAEGNTVAGPGQYVYHDYSTLPTDPQQLLTLIEQRQIEGGPPGDWETFAIISDLLTRTYTTPAVRGALFEVAADLPGVEYVGRTEDAAGRPGIAVAYTHDNNRTEMIFDPSTAQLLGENDVQTADTQYDSSNNAPGDIYAGFATAGTTTYTETYLVNGIVDSVHARP